MQPIVPALSRNPLSENGIGSVPLWNETVAELGLEFTQVSEVVAPSRVTSSLIISSFEFCCKGTTSKSGETWPVLVLAISATISSLMRPLFRLLFVTLVAHDGECSCH